MSSVNDSFKKQSGSVNESFRKQSVFGMDDSLKKPSVNEFRKQSGSVNESFKKQSESSPLARSKEESLQQRERSTSVFGQAGGPPG